jgi:PPOX class probable F420-dependent enzyme
VPLLTVAQQALLAESRRAVLATVAADGSARLLPITYAADAADSEAPVLYSALDEKRKSVADPRDLARVRDIRVRPRVTVLVDRWSELWEDLAWLRLSGTADLVEPDHDPLTHARALQLLRGRYPQYDGQRLERRPIVRITVDRIVAWSAAHG